MLNAYGQHMRSTWSTHVSRMPNACVTQEHRDAAAFTKQQRNAWLGHLSLACDARRVPAECKAALLRWAVGKLGFYGRFIDESE